MLYKLDIEQIEHFLSAVTDDKAFQLRKGIRLHSLQDLEDALEHIDPDDWLHHVGPQKNDFYNWVLHAIKDDYLAKRMKNVTHAKKMHKIVSARVTQLKRMMDKHHLSEHKRSAKQPPETVPSANTTHDSDVMQKLNEVVQREKEILIREEKIQQAENRIEETLGRGKSGSFFTKEFVQGILVGVLISVIIVMVYFRFF